MQKRQPDPSCHAVRCGLGTGFPAIRENQRTAPPPPAPRSHSWGRGRGRVLNGRYLLHLGVSSLLCLPVPFGEHRF